MGINELTKVMKQLREHEVEGINTITDRYNQTRKRLLEKYLEDGGDVAKLLYKFDNPYILQWAREKLGI